MAERESLDTTALQEELSAYLDGELDAESVRRIEERLARDAAYQAELHRLERAWGLLDDLPRASVDEAFTKSTIEMVAVVASEEARAVLAEQPRRRRRQRLLGIAGVLAAGLVGFVIGRQIWTDPNAELLADYPVLQDFELYYQADDINFLRALDAAGQFTTADEDPAGLESQALGPPRAATPDEDDLRDRRMHIANLSPADQQELLHTQERFLALPVEEQQRLRALQAAIEEDPKAEQLRQVLAGYHEWLKTLSTGERAELAEMPLDDRIAKIKSERKREEAVRLYVQQNELLTGHDKREIVEWLEDIVWKQRKELLDDMSSERRERFEHRSPQEQRRDLAYSALQRSRSDGRPGRFLDIDEQDVQRLAEKLSKEAQEELGKHAGASEQRKLVGSWISAAMFDRARSGRSRRSTSLPEADVAQFFQQLPARERDHLMSLPPAKAREELRRMYWQRERGEDVFRGGPSGPRPDGKSPERRKGPRPDGPPPQRAPHDDPPETEF